MSEVTVITTQLDVKRCKLPGFKLEQNCPKCDKPVIWDGEVQYLSFPSTGQPTALNLYCGDGCGHEWQRLVQLNLDVLVLD